MADEAALLEGVFDDDTNASAAAAGSASASTTKSSSENVALVDEVSAPSVDPNSISKSEAPEASSDTPPAKSEGQLLQEAHSEVYQKEFEEIKFAKNSPKEPYWPCIIYSPSIAPPKNKAVMKWMDMSTEKQSQCYIVYWFGYDMQFSCINKGKLIEFEANEEEMVRTKGGKKKFSAKMQALFDKSVEEAKRELEKPKHLRMQEKHLELIKEKRRRRRLPAIETLIHRRLQLADEDGDMFAGKIIEVKTGTSKEGVENVTLVRVQYDDGETDTDLDLAIEDFEWLKETKKKKVAPQPSSSEEESSSDDDSDSSSEYSDSDDSDSEYESGHRGGRKRGGSKGPVCINNEAKGVKKQRAFDAVRAFFENEFGENHPSYAYERAQSSPAKRKKAKQKKPKKKKVKKKYKGMTKEERRAARKKANDEKSARRAARQKRREEAEKQRQQEELARRAANPSVKVVTQLDAEDSEDDDYSGANGAEVATRKRNRQQMDDESEWKPNEPGKRASSSSAAKRPKLDTSDKAKVKKSKKKKKDKREKGSSILKVLTEYNSIFKSLLESKELNKKKLKKGLKKLAQVEISSWNDLQKSGLVETMLHIKKHNDVDVKQWGKGLIKLWKAKFQ